MNRYFVDLHIHTALSACADDGMTPPAIVAAAIREGLDMIAISDHNSTGNVASVQEAAGARIAVLAGMEITTAEEAHILGIFPDAGAAAVASDEVRATFPTLRKKTNAFGNQFLMDARGEITGQDRKMLFAASELTLPDTVRVIRDHGGLAIASHVDRPANSVMSQLGIFPTDVTFDAIEISASGVRAGRAAQFAGLGLSMTTGSDSHFLTDLGSCLGVMEMLECSFQELVLTLKQVGGRRCSFA